MNAHYSVHPHRVLSVSRSKVKFCVFNDLSSFRIVILIVQHATLINRNCWSSVVQHIGPIISRSGIPG